MWISNYLTKNYTLFEVEFEGETPSTPILSALTGECPRMDRDVSSHSAGGTVKVLPSMLKRHLDFSAKNLSPFDIFCYITLIDNRHIFILSFSTEPRPGDGAPPPYGFHLSDEEVRRRRLMRFDRWLALWDFSAVFETKDSVTLISSHDGLTILYYNDSDTNWESSRLQYVFDGLLDSIKLHWCQIQITYRSVPSCIFI